jgi:hypothetical protein
MHRSFIATFALLALTFSACDPVGERRMRVDFPVAYTTTRVSTTSERVALASDIADKMARRHDWISEVVTAEQQQRGVFRSYSVPVDRFRMRAEVWLSEAQDFIELRFVERTSLKESREAQRRLREFEKEFNRAFLPTKTK